MNGISLKASGSSQMVVRVVGVESMVGNIV
jgi:hypothetical protein